jgi:hypothetical protein
MHFEVPHKFGAMEGVSRVKNALVEGKKQAGDQLTIEKEEWNGNTLEFAVLVQGHRITGSVVVEEKQFIVDAKLPLLWRMFEGRIEKMIAEQVKSLS